ncbi:hypothetical protein B484DRAFT_430215 [Ochromonadaceae sp. CCMP2298]|nr:hypothetical protein B484DRAFT_430215 [Ochromonadaceae sp. CCMP2298]
MRSLSQHVKKASTAFIVGCMITTSFSSASLAAVGEGDLPPGALAFSKILKYQGDWKKLAATITSRPTEMDDKEILAAKAFMKSLANEYRDMELLSTGIMDKDKAQEARDTAKEFRKVVRACDDAATDSNMKKVAELYPESALLMDKYLGFLQDIPADL